MVELTPQQRFRLSQEQAAQTFGGQRTTPEGGIGLLTSVLGPARYGAGVVMPLVDDAYRAVRSLVTVGKGGKVVPTSKQVRQLAANEQEAARMAARFSQPTAREAARRFGGPTIAAAGLLNAAEGGPDPQIQNVTSPARIIPAIPGRPGTEVGAGMPLPPAPTQPSEASTAGLKLGNAVGDNNRERSFLERMAQSGLLSTLQGMARAERQYGVGPLAAFSESALDVQAARSAAQQKAAEAQLELDKERIKKSGPMEFKGPMIKTIEKASSTKQSLDAINRYLELLGNKSIGGVGAKVEEGINAIGALFGAGGESAAATADSIRSQIITGLQMGVSQGQISQGDYEQLNKILSGSGWFVSNPKVESQLQRLKGVLGGKLRTTTKILEAQGIDPSYFSPDAPSGLVSARRPAQ